MVDDLAASEHTETDDIAVITAWIESELGGSVVAVRQQARWRPMWFVTVARRDDTIELCVRGDRTDTRLTWPLEHEMRFQRVLAEAGAKVPAVYGWIEETGVYVMEAVPGRPDTAHLPIDARDRIVDEYLQELARIHALPLAPFAEAGIDRAQEPSGSSTLGLARMEQVFRDQKLHPNPFVEWVLGWIHRHEPDSQGREGPVVWDSGQFHHDDDHLVALVDLEIGHIGDPMMDLAAWRMRDSVIPFGDFDDLYARYGELTGTPVDIEAIQLHHTAFTISNALAFSHRLLDPISTTDYTTYLQWCNETNIYTTEAIAEYLGAELPTAEMPEPRASRFAAPQQHLSRLLRGLSPDDDLLRYRIRQGFRLAQYLTRVDEIGDAVTEADLDDAEQVLGRRPESWDEGELELERFVLADTEGRRDDDLLWLFHRRNLRAQFLNGPAGSAMARHNPIQPFNRRGAVTR